MWQILWQTHPDAGKDWGQEEKGATEDEMVGWHHPLNGHEFEQSLGDGDGQESLACCCPQGCKESDLAAENIPHPKRPIQMCYLKSHSNIGSSSTVDEQLVTFALKCWWGATKSGLCPNARVCAVPNHLLSPFTYGIRSVSTQTKVHVRISILLLAYQGKEQVGWLSF